MSYNWKYACNRSGSFEQYSEVSLLNNILISHIIYFICIYFEMKFTNFSLFS